MGHGRGNETGHRAAVHDEAGSAESSRMLMTRTMSCAKERKLK
jgi:hypothetical protein